MGQTSIRLWFVCRLCRGSFGQVDAFIEHKKQKHFTQFQNTTSIVFEETEHGLQFPKETNGDHQLADEINEPPIKIEVDDEDCINPFSSEIIDEPNLGLFEVKSEVIAYESEINVENENSFFGLRQPEQNPYVHLKRLTSDEIQSACVLSDHSTRLTFEQANLLNGTEPPNSFDSYSTIISQNEAETSTETSPAVTVTISTENDHQFDCKLCSNQLESEAQLKNHLGICALNHEDRNRFCVICNRKFCEPKILKHHRLRFHGTEEEKLSLYKFKCHVCPKQFREVNKLRFHLKSHKETKDQVEISNLKLLICSYPNCGKEFRSNSDLQRHVAIHSDLRPFSCSFPNCDKTYKVRSHLKTHFRTHTGERPYKCTVDNCNKTFMSSSARSSHHRTGHCN